MGTVKPILTMSPSLIVKVSLTEKKLAPLSKLEIPTLKNPKTLSDACANFNSSRARVLNRGSILTYSLTGFLKQTSPVRSLIQNGNTACSNLGSKL